MSRINPFDLPDDFEEMQTNEECPSCGVVPFIDGPTPGCHNSNGCGANEWEEELDESSDEEYNDFDGEKEEFSEDEEESSDELDF